MTNILNVKHFLTTKIRLRENFAGENIPIYSISPFVWLSEYKMVNGRSLGGVARPNQYLQFEFSFCLFLQPSLHHLLLVPQPFDARLELINATITPCTRLHQALSFLSHDQSCDQPIYYKYTVQSGSLSAFVGERLISFLSVTTSFCAL